MRLTIGSYHSSLVSKMAQFRHQSTHGTQYHPAIWDLMLMLVGHLEDWREALHADNHHISLNKCCDELSRVASNNSFEGIRVFRFVSSERLRYWETLHRPHFGRLYQQLERTTNLVMLCHFCDTHPPSFATALEAIHHLQMNHNHIYISAKFIESITGLSILHTFWPPQDVAMPRTRGSFLRHCLHSAQVYLEANLQHLPLESRTNLLHAYHPLSLAEHFGHLHHSNISLLTCDNVLDRICRDLRDLNIAFRNSRVIASRHAGEISRLSGVEHSTTSLSY